jgi:hypothetical protein
MTQNQLIPKSLSWNFKFFIHEIVFRALKNIFFRSVRVCIHTLQKLQI